MQYRRPEFDPRDGTIARRRAWQPIPVFLPGQFHGEKSLASYSSLGCKESDMTDQVTLTFTFLFNISYFPSDCPSRISPLFHEMNCLDSIVIESACDDLFKFAYLKVIFPLSKFFF